MNALRILGFLYVILFLSSCPNLPQKDFGSIECTDELIDLGVIKLDHSSLEYFPYDFNSRKSIYFKNAKGNVIKFRPPRTSFDRNYLRSYYDVRCEDGEIRMRNYTSLNERYNVFYKCTQKKLNFYAEISVKRGKKLQFLDFLEVKMTNQEDRKSTKFRLITSSEKIRETSEEKGYNPNYERLTNLDTLGEVFIDVFKGTNYRGRITELYYSLDLGLVGFNDTLSGFWIYDGME